MISQMAHVMTLANSIIGVSVLAMPFCFKQCGIVLAVLLLLLCSALSRLACYFLVKSAVISRRRNFELLAFHAFGHMGKFLAELFIIGFMLGTCIAYFVVVGDLGPQIICKMMSKNPADIRTSLLIFTGLFIVLPLGLLRNIDSLSSICTATIVFYLCLVLKIMGESTLHIFMGDWFNNINYWRPAGILQCLPIFSMALFCQTQLFEIYETIPNVSLEKMNDVVRGALNICTLVYMCVGLFGYIAFCTQPFTGNILLSFEPSITSELIKLGFVFSVAFSFPLVIFPCRASLNSLLFRRVYTHEPSVNYLPEFRFRCLTIAIVSISLIVGILVPNIEFVLGIVGSTIGVMICLIFPTIFFISISSKNTNERLVAQCILIVGVWIMILGTYANLYAIEKSTNTKLVVTNKPLAQINNLPLEIIKDDLHIIPDIPNSLELIPRAKDQINQLPNINVIDKTLDLKVEDVRQEPPIPVERTISEKPNVEKSDKIAVDSFVPKIQNVDETIKNENLNAQAQVVISIDNAKIDKPVTLKAEEKIKIIEEKEQSMDLQKNDNLVLDAIKKEESELAADGDMANVRAAERHEQLRKTLEKHKLEQRQMMQEQKEILKDIKEQKQEFEREKQRMAKDEILKKNEKIQIDVKENIVSESKINLIENSKKGVKNSEIIIEKNNKEVLKKKEWSKKSLQKEKQDKTKIERIESNDSKNMKGSILNALTKGVLERSVMEEELAKKNNNRQAKEEKKEILMNEVVNTSDKLQGKYDEKYSVPIALKMMNQSKLDKVIIPSLNKSESEILVIRRDILENNEREKRDIDGEANVNDTKVNSDHLTEKPESLVKDASNMDDETCSKLRESSKKSEAEKESESRVIKSSTIEVPLINTNLYLSEQRIMKTISMDQHAALNSEYAGMNQEDSKVLSPKDKTEI
ncbi:Putative sodium-coupled neutral amino acid transporter 10 [Cyphomyrmex costatus]|uniref:Putative sodium-coupled neutral amino acid transporter 10 n=1 Tax=Cyphomyrmex costatus TaxID=456900 RepID=A0A151IM05_9HYME|nr:Putative sodium-coupled neutral amino acid transporter 10 [Cyphomyrmex costatus]